MGLRKGQKGFTLVEILVVVSILGTLTAVVTPNVIGFIDKGGAEAYETDKQVIQVAVAAFYSDMHAGANDTSNNDPGGPASYAPDLFDDNVWANETVQAGHRLPTAIARPANHVLELNRDSVDGRAKNPRIDANGTAASDEDMSAHAIWMGLLANGPGDHRDDAADRGHVAPLPREKGPYLHGIPESARAGDEWNGGREPGGTYCWVVDRRGSVLGAYQAADGDWYSGYNGFYP